MQSIRLLAGSHLLDALGFDQEDLFDQIGRHDGEMQLLEEWADTFQRISGGISAHGLAQRLQNGSIAPRGRMSKPHLAKAHQGAHGYAAPRRFDFRAPATSLPTGFQSMSDWLQGATLQRFFQNNPLARQMLEMYVGGLIRPDSNLAKRLEVEPFDIGTIPGGQAPYSATAGILNRLERAAFTSGGYGSSSSGDPFMSAILGALTQLLGGLFGPAAPAAGGSTAPGSTPPSPTPSGGGPSGPSTGTGSQSQPFQPGSPGPYQPRFGMLPSDGSDVADVLNDPSLTVEDKVCLMLMLIMKQMDKEIERQAKYINSLQQQQNQGGGNNNGNGGSSPSIDVETMKLKRFIDKRSQMFDMLRQIIDKYNQTAKQIIDSIVR